MALYDRVDYSPEKGSLQSCCNAQTISSQSEKSTLRPAINCSPYSTPLLHDLVTLGIDFLWYNLGPHLRVPVHELEVIKLDNPYNTIGCSIQMFTSWLNNDSQATYTKLLRALVAVGRTNLAATICQKKSFPDRVLEEVLSSESEATLHPQDDITTPADPTLDSGAPLSVVQYGLFPSPAIEASRLVTKGKECFDAAQNAFEVVGNPRDTEVLAHLRELHLDGMSLVDNAVSTKLRCESELQDLQANVKKLCDEIRSYEKNIEKLKDDESCADVDIRDKEAEIKFDLCELERAQAEVEVSEAEESFQEAQKKAVKAQLIGAGLGALVAAFTKEDSWTVVGSSIGGVVAAIDSKIQCKRNRVERCRVMLERAEKAAADAHSFLGNIKGKIATYNYKIAENKKQKQLAYNKMESIEKLISFHKKSATFWGLFSAAATVSEHCTDSYQLGQVVKSGSEIVDTKLAAMDQMLTVAKPFLETWELLAQIDLKDLF